MMTVPLRFAGKRRAARLRELTGRDEYAVSGASTAAAIALLTALLEGGSAAELVAADRDRLLAAIYARAFGDRIESTLTCAHCGQPFDLDFSLRQLIESVEGRSAPGEWTPLGDGRFEGADGTAIRLPTGRDELALDGLPPEEAESFLRQHAEGEEELLERIAPLLDLELVARCAECKHVHTLQFDIQSYLLEALAGERRRLLTEVHRIASAHGWALDEILSLTRTDRRLFVELIENERAS